MAKDPMSMVWTEIPTGIWNGAVQRFGVALGDNAARVASRINMDPRFVSDLAMFAVTLASADRTKDKKFLQFLFNFNAEAVTEFVAKEKFVVGKTIDGVSIAWLGDNFKNNFLGKVEENVEAVELKVHKLIEAARDMQKDDEPGIIPELGGKHEITLAHFFQLLAYKQQKKDFSGIVAYICDENGVLWAVRAHWYSGNGGWDVVASSVEGPGRWYAGYQVVSR